MGRNIKIGYLDELVAEFEVGRVQKMWMGHWILFLLDLIQFQ